MDDHTVDDAELDRLQAAHKQAVENWIAAIREEEALASVNHDVAEIDQWEAAHFKEDEQRVNVRALAHKLRLPPPLLLPPPPLRRRYHHHHHHYYLSLRLYHRPCPYSHLRGAYRRQVVLVTSTQSNTSATFALYKLKVLFNGLS